MAIIGAGPAGLVLSHLLAARGIDSVVLERHDRHYVEHRIRAGVLEHPSVELLRELGVAERLDREGLAHRGIELAFEGRRHRLDFHELVGHSITVYGQQEIVKDLIAARLAAGDPIEFEVERRVDRGDRRRRTRRPLHRRGSAHELRCRVVAGCDGFHGISRDVLAEHSVRRAPSIEVYDRTYPFAWLGILAEAAPTIDELIYSSHDNGFALYSMRSPTITRLYLQVPADERLEEWSDDRIWSELDTRLPTGDGFSFNTGPILERGITAMRSFVSTPMRSGSLVIAGDAAHIVPPTGAKGMNLAIADVAVLADVLDDVISGGRTERLDEYTDGVSASRVALPALLVVDDVDAAPLRRRPVPPSAAAVGAAPGHVVDGGGDEPRRELRRLGAGKEFRQECRMNTVNSVETFAPVPPDTHPPLDYPDYRSTHLRHPNHDPLRLDPDKFDRGELTGPMFGEGAVAAADADLTVGPDGEAVGQRIIVTGRAARSDRTADRRDTRRAVAGQRLGPLPARRGSAGRARSTPTSPAPGAASPTPTAPTASRRSSPGPIRGATTPTPGAPPTSTSRCSDARSRSASSRRCTSPTTRCSSRTPSSTRCRSGHGRRSSRRYDHDTTMAEWALGFRFDIVLRGPDRTPFEEHDDG